MLSMVLLPNIFCFARHNWFAMREVLKSARFRFFRSSAAQLIQLLSLKQANTQRFNGQEILLRLIGLIFLYRPLIASTFQKSIFKARITNNLYNQACSQSIGSIRQ